MMAQSRRLICSAINLKLANLHNLRSLGESRSIERKETKKILLYTCFAHVGKNRNEINFQRLKLIKGTNRPHLFFLFYAQRGLRNGCFSLMQTTAIRYINDVNRREVVGKFT